MTTIAEAITEGARRLNAASVYEERQTASVLLGHLLGADRIYTLTRSDENISSSQYETYLTLIDRRAQGEPLQYLVGHQEFYGLDFKVTPDVLIPRPETEFLVESVIRLAKKLEDNPIIIDVGTGSGCIAVTLAFNLPDAQVIATDISAAALNVAKGNAQAHNVDQRINFLEGDLLNPLASYDLEKKVDLIASNPPYVPVEIRESLQREVRDWEPDEALYGGPGGLDIYRRLLADSHIYLKSGGLLICEIGYSQLDSISEMTDAESWELTEVTRDLQGIPRVMIFRKIA